VRAESRTPSFSNIKEVSVMLEDWRQHYNHEQPHGSLVQPAPEPKSTIAENLPD
jgi:transposase InsO family protein